MDSAIDKRQTVLRTRPLTDILMELVQPKYFNNPPSVYVPTPSDKLEYETMIRGGINEANKLWSTAFTNKVAREIIGGIVAGRFGVGDYFSHEVLTGVLDFHHDSVVLIQQNNLASMAYATEYPDYFTYGMYIRRARANKGRVVEEKDWITFLDTRKLFLHKIKVGNYEDEMKGIIEKIAGKKLFELPDERRTFKIDLKF